LNANVSEVRIASIFGVEEEAEQGTSVQINWQAEPNIG
jgi:hypothetical protein